MKFIEIITEEVKKSIPKQDKAVNNVKKTVQDMLKNITVKKAKTAWEGVIFTTEGSYTETVYSFAKTIAQAKKEIEARANFKKWSRQLKKTDLFF